MIVQYSLKNTKKSFEFIDIIGFFSLSENQSHENHNAHLYYQDYCYNATLLFCTIAEYKTHVYQSIWTQYAASTPRRLSPAD